MKEELLNQLSQTSFIFYNDPGHGWLEVPKKFVEGLGLKKEITPFSYYSNGNYYLEEDQDAGVFITAYKNELEVDTFPYVDTYQENCFVRNLPNVHNPDFKFYNQENPYYTYQSNYSYPNKNLAFF